MDWQALITQVNLVELIANHKRMEMKKCEGD